MTFHAAPESEATHQSQDQQKQTKRCAFFIEGKNRCCNSFVKPGYEYCGLHLYDAGLGNQGIVLAAMQRCLLFFSHHLNA